MVLHYMPHFFYFLACLAYPQRGFVLKCVPSSQAEPQRRQSGGIGMMRAVTPYAAGMTTCACCRLVDIQPGCTQSVGGARSDFRGCGFVVSGTACRPRAQQSWDAEPNPKVPTSWRCREALLPGAVGGISKRSHRAHVHVCSNGPRQRI